MAPNLKTCIVEIDDDSSEKLENQGPPFDCKTMIDEFLDLDCRRRLKGETCNSEELHEFEKKYPAVSFSQLCIIKQKVTDMTLSVHTPVACLDPSFSMDLGDVMRQAIIMRRAGIRVGENQSLQIREQAGIPARVVTPAAQAVTNSRLNKIAPDSSLKTDIRVPFTRPNGFPMPATATHVSDHIEMKGIETPRVSEIAHPSEVQEVQSTQTETMESRSVAAPKSVRMGKTFFPLTVQVNLSILTIFFSNSDLSPSSEAKQLFRIAAFCNMIGYFGCLADILIHKTKSEIAAIMGRIGATSAVFGFPTTMATLLTHELWLSIGVAATFALVFFLALTKLKET